MTSKTNFNHAGTTVSVRAYQSGVSWVYQITFTRCYGSWTLDTWFLPSVHSYDSELVALRAGRAVAVAYLDSA